MASVDHGLRDTARTEAETVCARAEALGLPARLLVWQGEKPDRRLQERARTARYALLGGHAREIGATHLVTAHTLDDQAETLLMRLAAGSGPRGLASMRPLTKQGDLVLARPFLTLRKAVLVDLCRSHGWAFVEDPGNTDARFARARWRLLMPALAAEGLTPERLGTLASRLRRAEDALQSLAQDAARRSAAAAPEGERAFAPTLFAEPDEIALRVLEGALAALRPDVPQRLARIEGALSALRLAHAEKARCSRTLGGCRLLLARDGSLAIRPEPRRRRGTGGASLRVR